MNKLKEVIYYDTLGVAKNGKYGCPKCSGVLYWKEVCCPFNDSECKDKYVGLECNLCKSVFQEILM